MMAAGENFEDTPLGGYAGESLPDAPAPPAQAAPEPLQIEPPPWAGQDGKLDLGPLPGPPAEKIDALSAMKLAGGDYEEPDGLVMAAPPLEPLRRPEFPAPDWRAEEADRARREREAFPVEHEPPKSLQRRPA